VYPRKKLLRIEWLGNVIIGPKRETSQFVDPVRPCRQHDDRRSAPLSKETAQLESIAIRQHDVEHD
jgi:hypothetical protein